MKEASTSKIEQLIDEIEEFIENSVGKHTDFDELKKKFILNTPEEFVRAIGENEND